MSVPTAILLSQYLKILQTPENLKGQLAEVKLSEALPVDNRRARLIIFLLRDPHLLECAQGRQDGATDPYGVLPLWGRNYFNLHRGWRESSQLLCHALTNALKHSGTSGKYDIGEQVLSDVNVTFHDGLEGGVVDPTCLLSDEARLEQNLWAAETLIANRDDVAVRELIGLLLVRALTCRLHLAVKVKCNVAEFLFHITYDLTLRRSSERVTSLSENLHHVLCQIAACQVKSENRVWQGIALVDRHRVRNAITRVHHDPSGAARGIQGEHCLDRNIHGWHIEGLKHDLRHPFAIGFRVQWGFSQQHRVLLRSHAELVVECVVPNLLHVVPIRDNAMLNRILQGQDTSLALGLITNIAVLLVHAYHDARHLWTANDGGKHCARGIITGEACLAHATAIVHHKSRNLIISHCSDLIGPSLEGFGRFGGSQGAC